jgi:hypothetical protein
MSPTTAMFWPMIAHAFLVFILYGLLLYRRKNQTLTSKDAVAQYREKGVEGQASSLVNRNIANQFELPVLFHAICLLLYITDADNVVTVVLAWLFVISRYAHSYVHVTSNRLRYRAPLFGIGFALLVCLWAWLAIWLALE